MPMLTSIRARCTRTLLILPCLLCALPSAAWAVTVRVDWSSTMLPLLALDDTPYFVSGSFGEFELPPGTVFPLAIPLAVPFTATTSLGPDPGDDVYTFTSNAGLGLAFGSPTFGRLVRVALPGSAPSRQLSSPGYNFELQLDVFGNPPADTVTAFQTDTHVGLSFIWSGPLEYEFTVVPEPASAVLLSLGLAAIAMRRARS
jgi:hypothetical protein